MKNLGSNLFKFGYRILITFIVLIILFAILFPDFGDSSILEEASFFDNLFLPIFGLSYILPILLLILCMIIISCILFILFIKDTFGYKFVIPLIVLFIIFIIYVIYTAINEINEEKLSDDTNM
tara:strand:- start:174 stop:542 length:369 start_codon:yes stop_codon:yes gene_type:complete